MAGKKHHSWWDMYADLAATTLRVSETLVAANSVIGSRVGTMRAAANDPLTADYAELARMVPEKVEAFARASQSLIKDAESIQAQARAQIRHATAMMTSGRIPTLGDWFALGTRSAGISQKMMGAAGKALLPVHAAATGNARRLNKGRGSR